jgi:hypothetical protein
MKGGKRLFRGDGAVWVRVDVLTRLRPTFIRAGYRDTGLHFTNAYGDTFYRFD